MDTYDIEEVKDLILRDNLTAELLHSILESTTRKIELYNDEESVQILEFIIENSKVEEDVKNEINQYLDKVKQMPDNNEIYYDGKGKIYRIFFVLGILCILISIILINLK
jgi:hypothetical protein